MIGAIGVSNAKSGGSEDNLRRQQKWVQEQQSNMRPISPNEAKL